EEVALSVDDVRCTDLAVDALHRAQPPRRYLLFAALRLAHLATGADQRLEMPNPERRTFERRYQSDMSDEASRPDNRSDARFPPRRLLCRLKVARIVDCQHLTRLASTFEGTFQVRRNDVGGAKAAIVD